MRAMFLEQQCSQPLGVMTADPRLLQASIGATVEALAVLRNAIHRTAASCACSGRQKATCT